VTNYIGLRTCKKISKFKIILNSFSVVSSLVFTSVKEVSIGTKNGKLCPYEKKATLVVSTFFLFQNLINLINLNT